MFQSIGEELKADQEEESFEASDKIFESIEGESDEEETSYIASYSPAPMSIHQMMLESSRRGTSWREEKAQTCQDLSRKGEYFNEMNTGHIVWILNREDHF